MDHTKSPATQPYQATRAAQQVAKQQAEPLPRCTQCRTAHGSQLEADLCCPANELTTAEALGLALGEYMTRRIGR
jgi:hypothetical protein